MNTLSIYSFFTIRWRTVADAKKPFGERTFSAVELICVPVSFVTIGYLAAEVILRRGFGSDYLTPTAGHLFARWIFPILAAAAVGYLASWLTVKMLMVGVRGYAPKVISEYLKEFVPKLVGNALNSPNIQAKADKSILSSIRARIGSYVTEHGQEVLSSMDLAGRIEKEVNALSMLDFHAKLDSLMAQHLSAIQVLGYVLGAIVGALQCL